MKTTTPPTLREPVSREAISEIDDNFDSLSAETLQSAIPRVAFFTDSFHEANGVALTSRQFTGFARERFYPFFSAHAGAHTGHWKRGNFETYELASGRASLRVEHDLSFDLGFLRHRSMVRSAVAQFRPDLIHVTGPSPIGILGALIAKDLGVPLVASWHTNIHEYAGRRLAKTLRHLPSWSRSSWEQTATDWTERGVLSLTLRFYQLAKLLFAPNPELVQMLSERTQRPVHLMRRGVDVELFHPRPNVAGSSGSFTIGYVGRLSTEKNVRILADVDRILRSKGLSHHRFLIVGEGSDREWLRHALPHAELPGLLQGEALATAYSQMDTFVFPSETDTFGNVILEAMASGVPPIVSEYGGPKYLVEANVNGLIATQQECPNKAQAFASAISQLMRDPDVRDRMASAARASALSLQWSHIFEGIYRQYQAAFHDGVLTLPDWTAARAAQSSTRRSGSRVGLRSRPA